MQKQYLARHNKVWQRIGTSEILTDRLTLKDGENLTDYRQVPKPKEQPKWDAKKKPTKEPLFYAENNEGGNFQ